MPRVVILRQDPFEHAVRESSLYFRWYGDKLRMFVPAQAVVGQRLASFELDPGPRTAREARGHSMVSETVHKGETA
jgi:hypothetical protein